MKVIFGIAACIGGLICPGIGQTTERMEFEPLKKAFLQEGFLQLRALNEIGYHIEDRSYQDLLFEMIFTPIDGIWEGQLFHILTQIDAKQANRLIECYQRSKRSDEDYRKIVWALTAMKGRSEGAYRFLKACYSEQMSPQKTAWTKIALIKHRPDWDPPSPELEVNLTNPDSEETQKSLLMMAMLGYSGPVNDTLIGHLIDCIEKSQDPDSPLYAAVILARFDLSTPSIKDVVTIIEKRIPEDKDSPAGLIYSMCLARIDKTRTADIVSAILKYTGSDQFGDNTGYFAIDIMCHALQTERINGLIRAGLSSRDEEVVRGALLFCYFQGYQAGDLYGKIRDILKNSPSVDTRKLAAKALEMVARRENLDELVKLAGDENDDEVREEINHTIRIIRLDSFEDSREGLRKADQG